MPSRPFGPAHRDLLLHLQDNARSTVSRQALLINAWRRHAMGKFWSHPLVDGPKAAFTTGTLGWVAKATPIRLFHRTRDRYQARALFDGGRLWVQAQWLDEQAAALANDLPAFGQLLEQGLRANARLALGMPTDGLGPWEPVSKSEIFYLRSGTLDPLHGDEGDSRNVVQALQRAGELQPAAHAAGWEAELARAASQPEVLAGEGEWQLWCEVLDEGLARRGHEAPMDPEKPWVTELLSLRSRVADRPVDRTTPDAMAELLEAMVATRRGSNVDTLSWQHANHPCFQAQQVPPLSDSPFAVLHDQPEHAEVRNSVCLEAWRSVVNHSNECFDSPTLADPDTGWPVLQATDYLDCNLLAHAALAALAQGQWLSSPQATGAYPWIHRLTYLYKPEGVAYSHPFSNTDVLAKAWMERPSGHSEPRLPPHPWQKSGDKRSWLLDQWNDDGGRDRNVLWVLWKAGCQHETVDSGRWWHLFSPLPSVGKRELQRFLSENPGWLTQDEERQERAMRFMGTSQPFSFGYKAEQNNRRLLLLLELGCEPLAWWACVETHVAVRPEDRSREMAERIFRLALKHFHGEPPSLNFQQAPVGPESVFRATLAHYRAKRLKKQKGPGVIQTPTRPRL